MTGRNGEPPGIPGRTSTAGATSVAGSSSSPPRCARAVRYSSIGATAEAIALEVVHERRGMGAILRAARGTRFDWYVGPAGADFETAVALEIGGTDQRSAEALLAMKLRQIRLRAGGLPGIAAAVQLLTPRAMLRDA